ncbi:glycosyltransferase family 2 protein [Paraglaciecola aquimarina]|uniref:Glycosyltransferase family 2 protein n=1 Tax=Paraglaciecola algarum TaxID=3050085 RepID=A0ABS9D496_9ALTE|nr:glycosyltransferase family 2 protein [Paraglaciecola sp. G1-23]MCF2947748.1 glycosyltransferase family 2 protein [Paraglaciecola sp. G1-23]
MLDLYSIVMFAHNEETNIRQSVVSALKAADDGLRTLYVIANGCTDKTNQVIIDLISEGNTKLQLVELEFGDKCNAWNHYVHNLANTNIPVHFFVDADVRFIKGSFQRMSQTLLNSEVANAVAGLPFSGRNQQQYLDLVKNGRCLFGNCYAVKNDFIKKIRKQGFHLPIGLGWIDSAITKIINRDLESIPNPKEGRIVFDKDSGYSFDSLSIFSKADRKLYISRIIRYRLGKYQEKYLEKIPFLAWPKVLYEINLQVMQDIKNEKAWFNIVDRIFVVKRIIKQNKKLKEVAIVS